MNVPCFVGISVWLFGPLISGACNVTLHAHREPLNFTSPNYPGYYRNNDNCYWDIYPETRGYRVVLEMVYSNIERSSTCAYDVLTIYVINNANQSKASSRRICGESRCNILIQEDQHFHAVFKTDSTGNTKGFLIRYYEKTGDENCGVPLVATSVGKTFTSPGYPNTYFLNHTCTWTITTEHPHQTIQLDTMDSVLQKISSHGTCDWDYVTVYNGQYGSQQLGTFCGNERPVFNSGGNALSVRLRTDSSGNYNGFKILYKAIPATTCKVALPAVYSPMVIVSPGYPNNYPNGLDCQWTIHAWRGIITVTVLFLDLENVSSCLDDYLLFKDGKTDDARQLAKICERRSTPIVSSSYYMTIMFHSDHAVTGGGFRLQYTSATDCGFPYLSASSATWKTLTSPGYPSNYDNNENCLWQIRAPNGYGIKVEILYLSLESSSLCSRDYLAFQQGSWFWSRQLGKYCGVYNNKQVVGTSSYMAITFHTDGSTTRPGFNLKYKAGIIPPKRNCSKLSASKYSWRYLSSFGYPHYNFSNYMYCEWTISAPAGYKVKVAVQSMSVEYDPSCSKDYVLFRGGSPSYASRLGKYCSDITGYIVSSRNAMTITFRTDSSTDKGFSLRYIAGCCEDDTISNETKYIVSPNYPLPYPNNADYEWMISTSIDGYVIHVEVVSFSTECPHDYVQLYDVTSIESSIGRWCGTDGPNTQISGQTIKVQFRSDGSIFRTGFKLSFTAGEPTYGSAASTNIGAILGGVFGGITVVAIATCCCCCRLCFRKKSSPNDQQQRNRSYEGTVSFINVPSYPRTTPTDLPFMFPPPPSYDDVVKDDPPPYCQAVLLSDIQPVVTLSHGGVSEG
ncbi:cubilin-like [Haliotis rubra]|uniref:cubilin-like n=1 Tax=Haliotis rubra TaxID=36100 RepID=UPI001EE5EC24|nr:cubilin-like [Haliotis rubra]